VKTTLIEESTLEAFAERAHQEAQAPPNSDERIRGVVLSCLVYQFRQMRARLAEVNPDWRPEK